MLKFDPTPMEASLGIVAVTIADVDGVKVAVVRTKAGFLSAGVSIPARVMDNPDELATERARTWAADRLKRFQRALGEDPHR